MNTLVAFIRLIRPLNLLIVVFTMYAMRWGVLHAMLVHESPRLPFHFPEFHFALTVLVVVLVAAAGNMINDYFDLKVDRVNKPERVIVGRSVKRRVVMAAHHGFNIIATALAAYVGWKNDLPEAVWLPVVMAALLWFYSLLFKKRVWIGNFLVAIMVAIVPLWAGVFEIPQLGDEITRLGGDGTRFAFQSWRWIFGFAGFAFWTTLIREIQKDIEDQKGDEQAGYKTIPIVWGRRGARNYLNLLFGILFAALLISTWEISRQLSDSALETVFFAMVGAGIGIPAGLSWYLTLTATSRADYGRASRWSKLTMAGGILIGACMPFWYI